MTLEDAIQAARAFTHAHPDTVSGRYQLVQTLRLFGVAKVSDLWPRDYSRFVTMLHCAWPQQPAGELEYQSWSQHPQVTHDFVPADDLGYAVGVLDRILIEAKTLEKAKAWAGEAVHCLNPD